MRTALSDTDRTIDETDGFTSYTYNIQKPVVTVEIYDFETGLHAKGNARCTVDDPWDEDFGVSLASTRATRRLCDKQERFLIKSTN
jgi:hypothetical protein